MKDFIGRPLSLIVKFLEVNGLNYFITDNSMSDLSNTTYFVTNIIQHGNTFEIVVSKFKLEV